MVARPNPAGSGFPRQARRAAALLLVILERPVKVVVVRVALAEEQVLEHLSQVRVVGLVGKLQRAAVVEVGAELRGVAAAEDLDGR